MGFVVIGDFILNFYFHSYQNPFIINNIKQIIKQAQAHSLSYEEYKNLINKLLEKGISTGNIQSESYLNYSKLSERRMKRWDKTFQISEADYLFFKQIKTPLTFLVISEGWCGDAAHALPILHKICTANKNISLEIVLRDDNEDIMQEFLTNGSKSIPKLIALNEHLDILFTWGPRPSIATKMVSEHKEKFGFISPVFKEELQMWYNQDKGRCIIEDIKSLLRGV